MFDGRHYTKEDLNLLIKETNRVKLSLAQKDEEVDRFIKRYLELVNRFDQDIADKMRVESDILPPLIDVGASCSMTLMSQA